MKIDQQQFNELKEGIVGSVADLLEGVVESLDAKIENLAISTAKGFDGVNNRIDRLENRVDVLTESFEVFRKDVTIELKLNHEETKALRSDMNKQFNQVNADIQLRRLLLD